jgi:hypothetical protein
MTDEQQQFRARLEAKHEELLAALHSIPEAFAQPVFHQLLRQLGMVAFWQSLTDPSPWRMADIYAALSVMLEVDEPEVDEPAVDDEGDL